MLDLSATCVATAHAWPSRLALEDRPVTRSHGVKLLQGGVRANTACGFAHARFLKKQKRTSNKKSLTRKNTKPAAEKSFAPDRQHRANHMN